MSKPNRQPLAETLEPRLLFSADPIAALLDWVPHDSNDVFSSRDLPDSFVDSVLESVTQVAEVAPSDQNEHEAGTAHSKIEERQDNTRTITPEIALDAPVVNQTNLIVNGDLETMDLTGWSTFGAVSNNLAFGQLRFGDFNTTGPHIASQAFATQVGASYTLSFHYRDSSTIAEQEMLVSVGGDETYFSETHYSSYSGTHFSTHTHTFVADATTSTLSFTDMSADSNAVDGYIDNVVVTESVLFTPVSEDNINNAGDSVAALLASVGGDLVTDPDAGAVEGIAVTNATWAFDFSLDGGSTWNRLDSVSEDNALLLRSIDLIRLVPNGMAAQQESIGFRAWDQTSGAAGSYVDATFNGGMTAFSIETTEASISTIGQNDSPTFGSVPGISIGYGEEGYNQNAASIVLADGSVLFTPFDSLGDPTIGKLAPDGQLDVEFGFDGYFESASFSAINDLRQQADGSILATGEIGSDAAIARYLSDGTLDLGFGNNGVASLSAGPASESYAVAVHTDGSIVFAGSRGGDSLIARLTSSGVLDTSFNGNGSVTLDLGGASEWLSSVSILADGRIVAAGESHVVRLTTTGTPDAGFGVNGILNVGHAVDGMVLQADGSIVVTGSIGDHMAISRFDADGLVDVGFGVGGTVVWTDPVVLGSYGNNVLQQADGKLLVVGTADTNTTFGYEMSVTRFNNDGSVDDGFGDGGLWMSGLSNDYAEGYDISVFDNGGVEKIVVGGYVSHSGLIQAAVARLNPDGTADASFQSGQLDASPTFTENGDPVLLDANVQIFDSELTFQDDFSGASLTLSRAGGADSDDVFGVSGIVEFVAGNVEVDYYNIGPYTNTGGELVIFFQNLPFNSEINAVLQSITYSNASDTPPSSVEIEWRFDDGNTGFQDDGGSKSVVGSTQIMIVSENDPPVALGNSVVVPEDTTTLLGPAAFLFNDSEGDALTAITVSNLDLQGGVLHHSGGSVIVSNGDSVSAAQLLDISFTPELGNPNSARFDYTVNDMEAGVVSATLEIHIDRVNDAPEITSFGGSDTVNLSVAENAASVTTITATDIDVVDSVEFSLDGNDSAFFTIDSTSGLLRFDGAGNFEDPKDQDSDNTYTFDVVATDQFGAEDRQTLNLSVENINEAPHDIWLSNVFIYDQTDTTGGYFIGTLSAQDEDQSDTLSFSLVGGADLPQFRLAGAQSDALMLQDGVTSVNVKSTYEVLVRATDAGGLSRDQMVEVFVLPFDNISEGSSGEFWIVDTIDSETPGSAVFTESENNEPDLLTQSLAQAEAEAAAEEAAEEAEAEEEAKAEAAAENLVEEEPTAKAEQNGPTLDGSELPTESFGTGLEPMTAETLQFVTVEIQDKSVEVEHKAFRDSNAVPLKQIDLTNLNLDTLDIPGTAALLQSPLILENQSFVQDLRRVSEELNAAAELEATQQQVIRDIGSGITFSVTAGVVTWVMKSGSILASLMSTVPAWKHIDPMPILSANKGAHSDNTVETQEEKRVSDMFG